MKNKGRLIVSVVGRLTVFFYFFTVLILILYIQGSFQDFLDESLINLLIVYKYSTLIFLAFAISYIIILLIEGKTPRRKVEKRIIVALVSIVMSLVFYIAVEIIITGLEPVS